MKKQDMETIKTWKIFIFTHSVLFWHKPFFWTIPKFGSTPILWTRATHAKTLTHATHAKILWTHATHAKILQTHATHAAHSKVWPTPPTHPRYPRHPRHPRHPRYLADSNTNMKKKLVMVYLKDQFSAIHAYFFWEILNSRFLRREFLAYHLRRISSFHKTKGALAWRETFSAK